jgi:hypothetical protein
MFRHQNLTWRVRLSCTYGHAEDGRLLVIVTHYGGDQQLQLKFNRLRGDGMSSVEMDEVMDEGKREMWQQPEES